jgi:hypothetical protein
MYVYEKCKIPNLLNIYYQNILFNMEQIYSMCAFILIISFTTEYVFYVWLLGPTKPITLSSKAHITNLA